MSVSHSYDTSYEIPALMVDIQASNPETRQKFIIRGKIDTGADLTDIPQVLQERLDLLPFSEEPIRYADDLDVPKLAYFKKMRIACYYIVYLATVCETLRI